jgi:hypothetical protein
MRGALLAAVLTLAPMMAMADESVSGQWQADLGHNVLIAMDVLADGHWSSQTVQNNKVVAELAGTYDQKKANDSSGTIVFKPVTAKTSPQHGQATVETDKYTLANDGKTLRLVSGKDVMVFHKQPYAE